MDLYFASQGSILKKLLSKRQQPSIQNSNLTKTSASDETRKGPGCHLQGSSNEKNRQMAKGSFAGSDSDHSTSSEHLKKRKRESEDENQSAAQERKKSMQSFLSESESPALKPSLYCSSLASGAIRKDSVEELLRSSHNSRMAEEETKTSKTLSESPKLSEQESLDRNETEQIQKAQTRMQNLYILLDEANNIAKQKGGLCLSEFCGGRTCPLSFRCVLNHRFTKSLDELSHSWCFSCESIYKGLKDEVEREFGGRLVEEFLKPKMTVECKNGHRFSGDYRSLLKKECTMCVKQKKEEAKRRMIEETRRKTLEDKLLQERLLDEARLKMLESKKNSKERDNRCAQIYQTFMQEIERTAIKLAKAFREEQKQTDQSVNDYHLIEFFKYELIPDEILSNYL
eukprot:TRINITY_DN2018_c0_g3_i6.p1 TRINITY_DN2018_c0_g3~~TRINITY_DN2018_c0_g3_i6.p1  ORF type:complete len:399 (-),score=98.38 TRINITY_DN2018_c0_g3_i6:493-1689(-)